MAHVGIHVVRASAEVGGAVAALVGAVLGAWLFTPTCTSGALIGSSPPVCSNKIGTVHETGKPLSGGGYLRPDDHAVGWAIAGISIGAAVGGALGYALGGRSKSAA